VRRKDATPCAPRSRSCARPTKAYPTSLAIECGWAASSSAPVSIAPISLRGRSALAVEGPRTSFANLAQAGGQSHVFALIWNLRLKRCLASKGVSARQPFCTKLFSSQLEGFGRHAGEQTHPHRRMTRTDKTAALFGPTFREYSSLRLQTFFRPVGSHFRQYPAPYDR
jgi:hypothetical protein